VQDGIDNASAGDTVFVFNGVYSESVRISKSVNITGENNSGAIIQYGHPENKYDRVTLLTVKAHNVSVNNLCFRPLNNDSQYITLAINAKKAMGLHIQHNNLINCKQAILIDENSSTEIMDNHIHFYEDNLPMTGIHLINSKDDIVIARNSIINYGDGIFLNFFETAPRSIIIEHNTIMFPFSKHSGASFDAGISFYHTVESTYELCISHNTITGFDFGFYYNIAFGGGPPVDSSSVDIYWNSFNNKESNLYLLPNSIRSDEELIITKNNFFGETTHEYFIEEIILDPFMIPLLLSYNIGLIHKNSIQWTYNYWENHSADKPKRIPGRKLIYLFVPIIAIDLPIHHTDPVPVDEPYPEE